MYFRPFAPRAWARAIARVSERLSWLRPLRSLVKGLFGDRLYTDAWNLTEPTQAECRIALLTIERFNPGTVIANYAFMAPLFAAEQMHGRKRVILMHDLLSARVQRFQQAGLPLDCPAIDEATEMRWLNMADCVLAAQASEADTVRSKVSAKILVQPIMMRPRACASPPEAFRCLFVGTNVAPNVTGLTWLVGEVWPKVLQAEPRATLTVAGAVCEAIPDGIQGVVKLGRVEFIEAEYAKAAVVVVPLLIGSGIKIKLIEALSFGKATVSTSVGIDGLEDTSRAIEVADDAETFARALLRLLTDEGLRREREQAALQLAERSFGMSRPLDPEFIAAVL